MIKRIREEKGGFTLAELLIVVAIILVLVAIAIPIFTNAQTQAAEAVQKANERSIKAEAATDYMLNGNALTVTRYYVTDTGDVMTAQPTTGTEYKTYDVSASGAAPNVVITVTAV